MSYLALPSGIPEFGQAVISLWFRVPQASLDSIGGGVPMRSDAAPRIFLSPRIVPLLTFGPSLTANILDGVAVNVAVYHYPEEEGAHLPIFDTPTYSVSRVDPTDSSYVAVCLDHHGVPKLWFNFQMSGFAIIGGHFRVNRSLVDVWPPDMDPPPSLDVGSGWESAAAGFLFTTIVDSSYIANEQTEFFHVETGQTITADKWHHLLLSVDLSTACNTSGEPYDFEGDWIIALGTHSACRLWFALDDVNYTGLENLGPYFVEGGSDPNAILTRNAWNVADSAAGLAYNVRTGPPTCNYTPDRVPSQGSPLGIPAAPVYVSDVSPVEMAELQVFTGVSFDTADTDKRRAFIDADGKPVPPVPPLGEDGRPLPDGKAPAEMLLGKKPDILLHGSGNWIKGHNTGVGITGELTPTGKITAYTPEPKLGA